MAKKPPGKDFSHSPFKRLKGLSVCTGQASGPAPPEPEAAEPAADFAAEMASLGVRRLGEGAGEAAAGGREASPQPVQQKAADDATLFATAVGRLDKVFKDERPEPPARAVPRRLKQVAQGRLAPEAELDLHGLTREQALDRLRFFLGNARHHGWKTVLVITGKGAHSASGPVLRSAVEACLEAARDLVAEWGTAPRRQGGEGALVVFLKGERKS